MAITQNYNVNPYFDDFDEDKGYHRILFKPGYAVQARELTQLQTILQNQIDKFGKHIFKNGSMVLGGQTLYENTEVFYLKINDADLNSNAVNVDNFVGKTILKTGSTDIRAYVIAAQDTDGVNPKTLIVKYLTANKFADSDNIEDESATYFATASTSSTGSSSVISIEDGVFFIDGFFVKVNRQSLILEAYSTTPSYRVGLQVDDSIYTENDDTSLLDPALDASNYQAPGANRLQITLTLSKRSLSSEDDSKFIELIRIEDGVVKQKVVYPQYSILEDTLARRTYDESGDYTVRPFTIKFADDTVANSGNGFSNAYNIIVSPGKAYVKGYEFETISPTVLISERARDFSNVTSYNLTMDYENYVDVTKVTANVLAPIDITTLTTLNVHCVNVASLNTTSSAVRANTQIGTLRVRALDYVSGANATSTDGATYRAYIFDTNIGNNTGNASGGSANTIVFGSLYSSANDAYKGVKLRITNRNGVAQTESKLITSYNGVTKTATVDSNWIYTSPDANTQYSLDYEFADAESFEISATATKMDVASTSKKSSLVDTYESAFVTQTDKQPLVFLFPYSSIVKDSLTNSNFVAVKSYNTTIGTGVDYTSSGYTPLLGNGTYSGDTAMDNFIVMHSSGLINFHVTGNTVTVSGNTVTVNSGLSDDIKVLAKIDVDTANNLRKTKTKKVANTTTVSTTSTETVATGYTLVVNQADQAGVQLTIDKANTINLKTSNTTQSLYVADVIKISKILDFGVHPAATANIANATDITNNYDFNDGQTDNSYEHASVSLRPGFSGPTGNVVIYADYYLHSAGGSFFSVDSYTSDDYVDIPTYVSPTTGVSYNLTDVIDFRPKKSDGLAGVNGSYAENILGITGQPFETDFSYYLGRIDKLVVTKNRTFEIVRGVPSLRPLPPKDRDDAMTIYTLVLPAYTGEVEKIVARFVENKRYTMRDIGKIEQRVQNLEYFSTLNELEKAATAEQFFDDETGLPRVKNGIVVDPFDTHRSADVSNEDYNASIDLDKKEVRPSFDTNQFNFEISGGSNYSANTLVITPSFTQNTFIQQPKASFVLSINPFNTQDIVGTTDVSSVNSDYPDTEQPPEIVDNQNNINDVWLACTQKYLDLRRIDNLQKIHKTKFKCYGRQYNWWKWLNNKKIKYSQFVNEQVDTQNKLFDALTFQQSYESQVDNLKKNIDKDVSNNLPLNVDFKTKKKNVYFRAKGLKPNATSKVYLNDDEITNYILKPDVITVEYSTANNIKLWRDLFQNGEKFKIVDVSTGKITAKGKIDYIEIVNSNTANVHVYVNQSGDDVLYNNRDTERVIISGNTTFLVSNESGLANNKIISYTPGFSAVNVATANTVQVTGKFANSNISISTITVISGDGAGDKYNVTSYNTSTRTITIDGTFNVIPGAISNTSVADSDRSMITIGDLITDSKGTLPGLILVPSIVEDTTIDDTYRRKYSKKSFKKYIKNVLKIVTQNTSSVGVDVSTPNPDENGNPTNNTGTFGVDPFAQTFIIDDAVYPQGISLTSVKLVFKQKDSNVPVNIQIRPTTAQGVPFTRQFGDAIVPNGSTYLNPNDIVEVSEETMRTIGAANVSPFSSNTYFSEAVFNAPVYLEPGKQYAIVISSISSKHELYMSRIGDKLYGTERVISSQPYTGVLYKMQNSSEWTPFPDEDLCFELTKATYANTATVNLSLKSLPTDLDNYGIQGVIDFEGTAPESNVNVNAFFISTQEAAFANTKVDFKYKATYYTGAVDATYQDVSTDETIELDDGKGTRVITNTNTSFMIEATMTTTNQDVAPYLDVSKIRLVTINNIIDDCGISNSDIVILDGGAGYSNAAQVSVTITGSNTTQATAIANVVGGVVDAVYITNPGSGYTEDIGITISGDSTATTNATASILGETQPNGGVADAKYITRKVTLADGFDAGDLRVMFNAYKPRNTELEVYYKVLSADDADIFENKKWTKMTVIGGIGSYSLNENDTKNYIYAPGTNNVAANEINYDGFTTFKYFAIKIVMRSTDPNVVPKISNFKAIALAELI